MAIASDNMKKMSGYKLHIVPTDQFKTNTLLLKMKAPLTKETVTLRSLLPYVLQSTTAKYSTTPQLRSYLDELYGANFYVDVAKKGEYQIISFTIDLANEKFLKNSASLLEKGIEFLADILLHPNIDGSSFDHATFENEKRSLQQRIQSIYDDKMRYAATRLVEEMCENEPYGLDAMGSIAELEKITPQTLYTYYKKAISEDEIDLYVIGDVEDSKVVALADTYFSLKDRPSLSIEMTQIKVKEPKELIEKVDVKQGKLNIGYRTNTFYGDQDYYPLQLFNGIFGGFSHSKLFTNVREKASLAYYAASRLESHKGLLMVMSGIETSNYKQALTIIHQQMEEMKQGRFSDDEIVQTKAVIKNQILETVDSQRGLVELLYHNIVSDSTVTLNEWLDHIEAVTKEEIISVSKKIELDTIYFMTGLEG